MKKKIIVLICAILLCSQPIIAHSGRTDSSGGHRDNKNASGLGYYHYHHGYGPHLHPNGICPYAPKDTIVVDNIPSTMYIGDVIPLSWEVTYYSSNGNVTWTSSDESVLTVSDGTLTANKAGSVKVTAILCNGQKTFSISVKPIIAKSISITNMQDKLEIGNKLRLGYALTPSIVTDSSITWTSSNNKVATISSSGEIEAIAEGKAIITATAVGGKKSSFTLVVYEVHPESITIDANEILLPLTTSKSIIANVLPTDTSRPAITWKSSDDSIVSVTDGILFGIAPGSVTITASCQKVSASISVTVFEIFPTDLKLSADSLRVEIESSTQLFASVQPSDTTFPDVTWQIEDCSILSIDSSGYITPISTGNTTITAICQDITATIPVEVYDIPLSDIAIDPPSMNLFLGRYMRIGIETTPTILFEPADATYQNYKLISSNPSVVKINNNRLTTVSEGSAVITVVAEGTEYSQKISVFNPNKYIAIPIILVCTVAVLALRKKRGI